jgi:hypothetical protein
MGEKIMQYTQTTITINGKTVTSTTTTTDDQNSQNNSNNKKTPKKDRLREIYGDYHYGLFGDIHRRDFSNPAFRTFLWFQYFLVSGFLGAFNLAVRCFVVAVITFLIAALIALIF